MLYPFPCFPCRGTHQNWCELGSSRGRGTRAAGWFDDYIQDRKDPVMKSMTLEGGIKGWFCAGDDYVQFMDG